MFLWTILGLILGAIALGGFIAGKAGFPIVGYTIAAIAGLGALLAAAFVLGWVFFSGPRMIEGESAFKQATGVAPPAGVSEIRGRVSGSTDYTEYVLRFRCTELAVIALVKPGVDTPTTSHDLYLSDPPEFWDLSRKDAIDVWQLQSVSEARKFHSRQSAFLARSKQQGVCYFHFSGVD